MILIRVHAGVQLRENFAEFDIIKFLALEELVYAQLKQEKRVVEGLGVDHLLLTCAKTVVH